jgi:hypothetical protein
VLQEYIMTKEYSSGKFPSAVFLVFCNRILALVTTGGILSHVHCAAPITTT